MYYKIKGTKGEKIEKLFKKQSISKLKAELDRVFSLFIRNKYADGDKVTCYTCNAVKTIKTIQCGHFISRRHLALRWDEDNCRPQCQSCNLFQQGRQFDFGYRLKKELGKERFEKLLQKQNNKVKMTAFEYSVLIAHYKLKL